MTAGAGGTETTGLVTTIVKVRNFGFVRSPAFEQDIFFHRDAVEDLHDWEEMCSHSGMEVSLTVVPTDKGLRGLRVRRRG